MLRLLVALLLCLTISAQTNVAQDSIFFSSLEGLPVPPETQEQVTPPPPTETATVPSTPTESVSVPATPKPTEAVSVAPPTQPATTVKPAPVEETVWLCDKTGARRGSAGSPEAEALIAQGISLDDCVARPPSSGTFMCDANGKQRGRATSPYARALVRRGVQLQPCGNGGNRRPTKPAKPAKPATGVMCDSNGRRRGSSSSPYVRSLVRQGVQLQPCAQGATNARPSGNSGRLGNRVGGVGASLGNRIGGVGNRISGNSGASSVPSGSGTMCDANGRRRGSASSPYVRALVRQGMQLTPCAARATDSTATEFTSSPASSTAPAPAWAIALIVVGSILLVVLLLVVVRLAQVLKAY